MSHEGARPGSSATSERSPTRCPASPQSPGSPSPAATRSPARRRGPGTSRGTRAGRSQRRPRGRRVLRRPARDPLRRGGNPCTAPSTTPPGPVAEVERAQPSTERRPHGGSQRDDGEFPADTRGAAAAVAGLEHQGDTDGVIGCRVLPAQARAYSSSLTAV